MDQCQGIAVATVGYFLAHVTIQHITALSGKYNLLEKSLLWSLLPLGVTAMGLGFKELINT